MPAWSHTREWMKRGVQVLVALLLSISVLGCGDDPSDPEEETASLQGSVIPDSMTIPRMLETDDRFSTLRAALDSTGLDSLLATDGPFTLFVPPNDAFDALPPGTMDVLLSEEPERLRTILYHHVLEGRLLADEGPNPQTLIALSGDTLSLRRTKDGLSVGEVSVVEENVEAANGLLYVVDEVLLPPSESDGP